MAVRLLVVVKCTMCSAEVCTVMNLCLFVTSHPVIQGSPDHVDDVTADQNRSTVGPTELIMFVFVHWISCGPVLKMVVFRLKL